MNPAELDRLARLTGIPIPKETPMTDLARAARMLGALAEALDQPGGRYYAATVRDLVRVLDDEAAAALLAAARREVATESGGDALATLEHARRERDSLARRCAVRLEEAVRLRARIAELERREPRVWLPGDTVPAGVAVIDEPGCEDGGFWVAQPKLGSKFDRPVMEIQAPAPADFAAAVAAEQTRRAGVDR